MSKNYKICLQSNPRNLVTSSCKDCKNINSALITSAAYMNRVIWPKKDINGNPTVINISFLSDGNEVEWTPLNSFSDRDIYNLEKEINGKVNGKVAVMRTVKEILEPLICLKFKFVNTNGDIIIGFNPEEGSYSVLGKTTTRGEKTMNLGWLDVGTIIHEFLHALGAIHEHQNPIDNPIQWNKEKVYEWTSRTQGWDRNTTDINIFNQIDKDALNASNFDIDSIMLYFFPSEFTLNNKGTKQNYVLSKTDIEWLNNIYSKDNTDITDILDINSDKVIKNNKDDKNFILSSPNTNTVIIILIIFLVLLIVISIIFSLLNINRINNNILINKKFY